MTDEFGDRMKAYEAVETARSLNPLLPIYVRLDGRSFSKFTRDLERPYDWRVLEGMINTTKYLVDKTNARIGYTQSDEISLVFLEDNPLSEGFFSGKLLKINSVLAGMATAKFMMSLPVDLQVRLPHFDCRVIQLPSKTEAANMILWRAMDAKKNSIQMIAQKHFSAKKLLNKNQDDMKLMLEDIGVNFEDFPTSFLYGSFYRRETFEHYLTNVEMSVIPINKRPENPVIRHKIKNVYIPMPFNLVKNREDVIFNKAAPEI